MTRSDELLSMGDGAPSCPCELEPMEMMEMMEGISSEGIGEFEEDGKVMKVEFHVAQTDTDEDSAEASERAGLSVQMGRVLSRSRDGGFGLEGFVRSGPN